MPKLPSFHIAVLMLLASAGAQAGSDAEFMQCIERLEAQAAGEGVSAATLRDTLPGVERVERVIDADRAQPEFRQTFWEYLHMRVSENRVERGRELLREHYRLLHRIYLEFGVRPEYLLAFWGLETNYGGLFGNIPWLDALATLACDPRRETFFSKQFVIALQLHDRGLIDAADTPSSWAGAIGHTQFMPSTVIGNAIDYDRDGRIDLFNSLPDALASAANYLRNMGWHEGERWGREVVLPEDFDWSLAGLDKIRSVTEWRRSRLEDAFGRPLPIADMPASLLLPMGHEGPAFLVYDNFHIIMRWNRSIAYAIAVGHLADRIAGMGRLAADEPDASQRLSIAELREIQRRLNARGFDSGEPDGVLGSQTRTAARAFQRQAGLPADGYPDRRLLRLLRNSEN